MARQSVPNSCSDPTEMNLSAVQLDVFSGWKRPHELFSDQAKVSGLVHALTKPVMVPENKIDLVQDITADCSVVASLCAATARAEKGHSKVSTHRVSTNVTDEIQVDNVYCLSI